jgi:hypothetical protein
MKQRELINKLEYESLKNKMFEFILGKKFEKINVKKESV